MELTLFASIVGYFVNFSHYENNMLLKNFLSYFHPWIKIIELNKAYFIKQTCGVMLCNTLICDYSIEKKMNPDNSLLFRLCYPLKNYFNFSNSLLPLFYFSLRYMKPELNSLEKYSLYVIQKIDEYTLVWHSGAN